MFEGALEMSGAAIINDGGGDGREHLHLRTEGNINTNANAMFESLWVWDGGGALFNANGGQLTPATIEV